MTKLLHIIANPKREDESYSQKLAKEFIKEYNKYHPEDVIEVLYLYDLNIPYINEIDIQATLIKQGKNLTEEEKKKFQLKDKFIAQLQSADKIIVTFPMWNFSIPAILKAYIDHIVVVRKTFQYGPHGPEGLLKNKKVCFIFASGGDYSKTPDMDMALKYMKLIFAFIGVKDQVEVKISGVSMRDGWEERWHMAIQKAREVAKIF